MKKDREEVKDVSENGVAGAESGKKKAKKINFIYVPGKETYPEAELKQLLIKEQQLLDFVINTAWAKFK